MSPEIWSLIAVVLGTGATILIGMVGLMLKLWGETHKRLDRQDERIEALSASLRAEIHATNERVEAANASLLAEIRALRTENNQRFAQIEQRFIRIDERFIQIEQRFIQIDDRFIQIDQRFAEIDQRFTEIDQRFDRLAERQHADISAVNARLDALVLSQGTLIAALTSATDDEDDASQAAPRQPLPASQTAGA